MNNLNKGIVPRIAASSKVTGLALSMLLAFALNSEASTTVGVSTLPKGADLLYPFVKTGKTGFMDESGHVVIKPVWNEVDFFFEGMAAFQENGKWGFINRDGDPLIAAVYDAVGEFSEGFAPVRVGHEWGYINTSGHQVVAPKYQAAGTFHDGVARVATWEGFICFDGRGQLTNANAPEQYFGFPDKLGYYGCAPKDPMFGFINHEGQVAIPLKLSYAFDFSSGIARISLAETGDLFGYIRKDGSVLVKPRFTQANDFSESRAAVESGGKWGYIDTSGSTVVPFKLDSAPDHSGEMATTLPSGKFKLLSAFSGKLARAEAADGTKIYVDRSGQIVSPH